MNKSEQPCRAARGGSPPEAANRWAGFRPDPPGYYRRMSASTLPRTEPGGTRAALSKVAVVAHQKKTLGGGLRDLRRPLAGSPATVAVIPAGTANLLASNLGIPPDLPAAVQIGLSGRRQKLDLGKLNGEHFAVMAGAGFDGRMIRDADRDLKEKAGRLAYVWTGMKQLGEDAVPAKVRVDGADWFDGKASCVLLGNVGTITGGIQAFPDARPDDGWLEVGVATAEGALEWARTLGKMIVGRAESSPFVRTTRAKKVDVAFGVPVTYELDGGARTRARRLKARVVPHAVTVCVPDLDATGGSG